MIRLGWLSLGISSLIFAAFSSSGTDSLNSYGIGPGGTNNSASGTYSAQATIGEQSNNLSASGTYTAGSGSVQTEQITVPPAPTLSTGGGIYSNILGCTINTGTDPSDATYAIAVSTDNFTTTNYVQGSGALGSSPVFQSYSTWGSSFYIIGLSPSTTYEVKVSAKQGLFTNTEYGTYASATTAAAAITFSLSANSYNLGTILPGTIVNSSGVTISFGTTAASGGSIYVAGQYGGFFSPSFTYTIPEFSGNLSSATQGFGIQAGAAGETSGGPFSIVSPFGGISNNVGGATTTFTTIMTSTAAVTGGHATAQVQVKALPTAPAASDYTEVLTFLASASF